MRAGLNRYGITSIEDYAVEDTDVVPVTSKPSVLKGKLLVVEYVVIMVSVAVMLVPIN